MYKSKFKVTNVQSDLDLLIVTIENTQYDEFELKIPSDTFEKYIGAQGSLYPTTIHEVGYDNPDSVNVGQTKEVMMPLSCLYENDREVCELMQDFMEATLTGIYNACERKIGIFQDCLNKYSGLTDMSFNIYRSEWEVNLCLIANGKAGNTNWLTRSWCWSSNGVYVHVCDIQQKQYNHNHRNN